MKENLNNIRDLDYMIELFQGVRVVKNCQEWDWEKRFPTLEAAVDVLLKQLASQRDLLILSAAWQKKILQENNKSKIKLIE
jgi:hypothetical protein|tara:strand:- start:54 stop:296 length:243 start_codon:yes stop_codon:yes gene_type:complete